MAKTPAWQRAEGKSESGGLNEKGRASLRAAGHDIKRPQPEGGSRRDSFCARMKGMKSKLTSSETANDPDSRINKSLRKWNCADGGAVDPYDSVQQAAKGGPIWDKPRPKKLGKPEPLSSKEKASAKASAEAAGRPYPNLIDNMRAARADGGMTYPLAQRGNWTVAKHYEKMGGKLTHMSPDQFLEQTRPLKMDRKTRDDIDRIKNHISNGYHLNPLQLLANGMEDGRHRAYAAKELGVKSVPVVTFRADGGEVEGDVKFAEDDPYAKVQDAAKLPMMARHEYAMRMPEPEVRYDTGPQPGEATLKGYDPTIKERIYQGIAGTEERPSPERAQFARGMSQMAEFAPVLGNVMAGQEAQRRGDTKGMLMAALPVPGMATEARMAEAAAGPAADALLGVHNLRSHRLGMVEKLGGQPVPSIAITKPAHGFTSYGDVSLVASPELIAPRAGNPVYASDVYSPRFPSLDDEGERIFRGFTNLGNRRYAPLTMENVVREMKGNIRGGENFNYGAGNVRASVTPQFKNLKQIQNARGNIVTKEEFEPYKEKANNMLFELADKFHPYSRYSNSSFGHAGSFAETLSDIGRGKYSAWNQDYKDLPDELKQEAFEYLKFLKNMPTEYFEAKPQRGVQLGEFAGAVVPENIISDIEPRLKNLGVKKIVPFNPEEEGGQQKAFKEFDIHHFEKGGEVVNDTDPYDNIRDASKNFPRARRASH